MVVETLLRFLSLDFTFIQSFVKIVGILKWTKEKSAMKRKEKLKKKILPFKDFLFKWFSYFRFNIVRLKPHILNISKFR